MPWVNPEYHAYFLLGLEEVFGKAALRYDASAFPSMQRLGWYENRDTFAFVHRGVRYSISANDFSRTNPVLLDWSDVHGSVNVPADSELVASGRVVPVGPNFAFRVFDDAESALLLARSLTWRQPVGWSRRALVATLRRQRGRAAWTDYQALAAPSGARVYYQGTYWSQHPSANVDRVAYLSAAREALGPERLAGGLVSKGGPLPPELHQFASGPVQHGDYVKQVQQSPFVFNSPAVHGCLGWKLGEFFALGKAIITTPITNALPGDPRHGQEWHVCDGTAEALAEAVLAVDADEDYRRHLESAASEYFRRELSPARVIDRLVRSAGGSTPSA